MNISIGNFEAKRGLELLDRDSLRCYKVPMKFLFKTGCFSLFTAFLWASAFAASGPIIVNVNVPSGQWKAARLNGFDHRLASLPDGRQFLLFFDSLNVVGKSYGVAPLSSEAVDVRQDERLRETTTLISL